MSAIIRRKFESAFNRCDESLVNVARPIDCGNQPLGTQTLAGRRFLEGGDAPLTLDVRMPITTGQQAAVTGRSGLTVLPPDRARMAAPFLVSPAARPKTLRASTRPLVSSTPSAVYQYREVSGQFCINM
jgi:hypothetical protein